MSRNGNIGLKKILSSVLGLALACATASAGPDYFATNSPSPKARVVEVEDPHAMIAFRPQPDVVRAMLDNGILKLANKPDLKTAWQTFVSQRDIVGIKVYSEPGSSSGTRPAVVAAMVEELLAAGLPPEHVVIWDKRMVDLRLAGFDELANRYKVRIAGALDSGFDEKVFYDNSVMGNLMAGDLDFDKYGKKSGRKSYVSKLLTKDITKIISIAPLLNHNLAGVCGNLYSVAMGAVDNTLRFEESPERLARAVPEIYAMTNISDHVVLNVTDALIGQYQGEQKSLLHYSSELNQLWLSKDAVALDTLAIEELDHERREQDMEPGNDNPDLFRNASFFLELGVNDPSKIHIDEVK